MAETVTVGESQGPRYTWANASFTWASASARKSWLTAYPAVYVVTVAATLAWVEASGRQHGKRLTEALSLAETRRHQAALQKTESIGFADTYYDLIAYVLRWVESIGVGEGLAKSSRKSVQENLRTLDGLARSVAKALQEGLPVTEGLSRQMRQKHAESLPVASVSARVVTKAVAERVDLTDGLDQRFSKRVTEALNFAETYYDLIAFILRIGEGLAVSDQTAKRLQKPVSEAFTTSDQLSRQSVKQVAEALAFAETLGRTVAYRRHLQEGLGVSEALRRAMRLKAYEALARAKQLDPNNPGVWFAEGSLNLRNNKPEEAQKLLREGLRLDPNNPGAYFDLGNAQIQLKELNPALASFEKAAGLRKGFWEAVNNQAIVLFEQGRTAEAVGRSALHSAIPRIVQLLADDQWWVRFRAAEALTRLGAEGRLALQRATADPDWIVREAANTMLAEQAAA